MLRIMLLVLPFIFRYFMKKRSEDKQHRTATRNLYPISTAEEEAEIRGAEAEAADIQRQAYGV